MRIAILGAGIAGLSAATELLGAGFEITVYEGDPVAGGRAKVVAGAEHCARIFLDDYHELRRLLNEVPSPEGDQSMWASLTPVHRMLPSANAGWISIDGLFFRGSHGIRRADRRRAKALRSTSPLLASASRPTRRELVSAARKLSLRNWHNLARRYRTSYAAFALSGSTDECLINPWVDHLKSAGIAVQCHAPVEQLHIDSEGLAVEVNGVRATFDGVIVALSLPAARDLLDRSGVDHTLPRDMAEITHAAPCITFVIDEAEVIVNRHLGQSEAFLYSGGGFCVVFQPPLRRCVVVATTWGVVDADELVPSAVLLLDLKHPVTIVGVRRNLDPSEAVFAADPIDPAAVARIPRVVFAGSYLCRSYPLDSGEAAARSAVEAVAEIRRQLL